MVPNGTPCFQSTEYITYKQKVQGVIAVAFISIYLDTELKHSQCLALNQMSKQMAQLLGNNP